jgi:hypothetical protein
MRPATKEDWPENKWVQIGPYVSEFPWEAAASRLTRKDSKIVVPTGMMNAAFGAVEYPHVNKEKLEQIEKSLEAALRWQEENEENKYKFLSPEFLKAMNDIGEYGYSKYGERSFQTRRTSGEPLVRDSRTQSQAIADHARDHFSQYLSHETHDYFGDDIHQLAAVAFNAMMEVVFAGLDRNDG